MCTSLQHTSAVDSSPGLPVGQQACAFPAAKQEHVTAQSLAFTNDNVPAVQADAYELPIKLNCDLRAYQREGISWLAFLKRTGLHGCLADVSHLHLCARKETQADWDQPHSGYASCLMWVQQRLPAAASRCEKLQIKACVCTDRQHPCRQVRIGLSTVPLIAC